jgi:hypothetical protein
MAGGFKKGDVRVVWFAGSKMEMKVIDGGSIDLFDDSETKK